jgi:hypothetical protein
MTSNQTDPSSASEPIWDQQQNGGSSREVLHVIINELGQLKVISARYLSWQFTSTLLVMAFSFTLKGIPDCRHRLCPPS